MTRPQRWERDPMRSDASMLLRPTPEREAAARTARGNLAALCCGRAGVDVTNPDPVAVHAAAADIEAVRQNWGLDGGRDG